MLGFNSLGFGTRVLNKIKKLSISTDNKIRVSSDNKITIYKGK